MPFKAFWLRIVAAYVFECIFKQDSFSCVFIRRVLNDWY